MRRNCEGPLLPGLPPHALAVPPANVGGNEVVRFLLQPEDDHYFITCQSIGSLNRFQDLSRHRIAKPLWAVGLIRTSMEIQYYAAGTGIAYPWYPVAFSARQSEQIQQNACSVAPERAVTTYQDLARVVTWCGIRGLLPCSQHYVLYPAKTPQRACFY